MLLAPLLSYQFMQNAVIACIAASVVCGIIGVIIVEKKIVMMSGGIAHASYGGVGLGYLLGFEPLYGAFLFAVLSAFGLGFSKQKGKVGSDAIIGMFWSLGMALGILFIALTPGYPPDVASYLFGNILSVKKSGIILIGTFSVFTAFIVIAFFNHWKAYLFDEEFISVIGVKKSILDFALLTLIAMSIVALIKVAGIVLIIALLTAPAATAALLFRRLKTRMIFAVLFCLAETLIGLFTSYYISIPSGAVIVILSVSVYAAVYLLKYIISRVKKGGYA